MVETEKKFKQNVEDGGIVTPVPDPTVLTTQQLLREISTSREVVETHLNGVVRMFETRIDAMDKAIQLLQTSTDKFSPAIVSSFKQLQELHEEKFSSIKTQFLERDTRTEQTSRDSKVAVDAALQAAKEAVSENNKAFSAAVAKSEASTLKQIDQITITSTTMAAGLNDKLDSMARSVNEKIDDVKDRLTQIESRSKGGIETWGFIAGLIGLMAGVAGTVVALIVAFRNK
jgi:hypothetical protein